MSTLGFCNGSDRYYAVGEGSTYTLYNALGHEILTTSDAPPQAEPVALAGWFRGVVAAYCPYRFEVGDPETLNADLRDPTWKSWDDPTRTAADRPVVKTVYPGRKDGYTVELSDGSLIAYPLSREDLADLRKA